MQRPDISRFSRTRVKPGNIKMRLLKPDTSMIQVSFNAIDFFRNRMQARLKQDACFIEVSTMTGFTVFFLFQHENICCGYP